MVIGFKPQFVEPILLGKKIHTVRQDNSYRWHEGSLMHMATGVRTKSYHQFAFHICKSVQFIEIWEYSHVAAMNSNLKLEGNGPVILVNERPLAIEEETIFAMNDGFDNIEDFYEFFFPQAKNHPTTCRVFYGRLLHWTNLKY